MSQLRANGIEIEVETHGPEEAAVILVIRGLGTQLSQWPPSFLEVLAAAGHRVVAFDNRDVGLSQKFSEAGLPELAAILSGKAEPAYHLADMANDAVGVLDGLDIERAHIMGMSMGGMIVQHLAATHPGRCLSATSIMSSSGAPGLPPATQEAMEVLTSRPEDPTDRECVIAHSMKGQRVLEGPGFPRSDADLRHFCEAAYDRCHDPEGVARQMAAVISDGSREALLEKIELPFLVLHGADDPLVPLACGEDTARRVRGARIEVIEGMGHSVCSGNAPLIAEHLLGFIAGLSA